MGYNFEQYKNLTNWYKKAQTLPHFEENQEGAKALAAIIKGGVDGPLF